MPNALNCLFCSNALGPQTDYEHVIQESIGGSLKSKKLACTKCNGEFSKTIDFTFAQKYARVMNALGPAMSRGGPNLDLVNKLTKKRLRLESGLVPQLTRAEILLNKDGRQTIKGADPAHVNKIAKKLWNKDAKNFVYDTSEETGSFEADAPVLHEEELRAVAKMTLNYLGYKNRKIFDSDDFSDVIAYVRLDTAPPRRLCFIQTSTHQYRPLFQRHLIEDPFCHRIAIACGSRGIQAVVILFDAIPYRITLSNSPQTIYKTLLYQKNILKGSPQSPSVELDEEIDLGGFDNPRLTRDALVAREAERINALCGNADWHVTQFCKDHIVDAYLWKFRRGRKPGELITISSSDILDKVFERIELVFLKGASVEARTESQRIKSTASLKGCAHYNEKVDDFSLALKSRIWEIHTEIFSLHKKYVAQPQSRFKSLGHYSE